MSKLDILVDGIPEEICLLVKYGPRPEAPHCCFRVEMAQGPQFKPYVESVKEHLPSIVFMNNERYVWFGSTNPADNDTIADWFDVRGYPNREAEDYNPHIDLKEASGRQSIIHDTYPWDEMKEIGDHFLVENGNQAVLSVMCTKEKRKTGKRYRTTDLETGVLVILVDTPNPFIRHIVRKEK